MIDRALPTMTRSKWLVLGIIALGIVVSIIARIYVASGDGREALAHIDCSRLQKTIGELQGMPIEIEEDRVCAALHTLAVAEPIADGFEIDESDPFHYIGRVRVQPERAAWFLVFVARRSTGFRPEVSLRNRRGAGWAIVGHFDATRVLEELGLLERIDRAKLESPASREIRDQRQAL